MSKAEKSSKIKRVKPELPGGFRDYAPQDALLKQRLILSARKTFEDFGFEPMETPSVERTEVLLGGEEESDKIIFKVDPSTSSGIKKEGKLSLRFDLTVPLARFVAANPEIPKPFKRYQIGQVFRGESPQAGRYREFTQADIDIVGASSPEADAEIIAVIYYTLKNIGLEDFVIKINSRKVLNRLPEYAGFPEKKLWDVLRAIDKKDKIGEEGVVKELRKKTNKKVADKVREFISQPQIGSGGESAGEAAVVTRLAKEMGVAPEKISLDPSLVRGLSYYTGLVFEAVLTKGPAWGSIFSGGRYDDLIAAFTGQKLPAVGASLGVDRLLAAMETAGTFVKKSLTKVLILNLEPRFSAEYLNFARALRNVNVNTSIYIGDDRAFQAQLAYAVKKEIPYVLIYGDGEKKKGVVAIKNLATREQKEISKNNLVEYFKK